MNFASDNVTGASQPVLDAIIAANAGPSAGYGADTASLAAADMLAEIFETPCTVSLVATGTAANAMALAAVCPPWGAVFCHEGAHVNEDECGAPEFFTGGAKLIGLKGTGGKIAPETLAASLPRFPHGVMHHVQPGALTLSQATECGTVYSCKEIAALASIARGSKMPVHMDGARFANALVTLGCTPAEMTWKAGVDVLSFGATKNGALACEAVVFFNPEHARNFAFLRKRGGHTLSKSRLLGAQMQAYLHNGHWLDLAARANASATALAEGLLALPGVRQVWPRQANELFFILPHAMDAALRAAGAHYYPWYVHALPRGEGPGEREAFVRLVTSFATEPQDVAKFIAVASAA